MNTNKLSGDYKSYAGVWLGTAISTVGKKHGIEFSEEESKAWGIIGELYLSHVLAGFPLPLMRSIQYEIKQEYGVCHIDCSWYEDLIEACYSKQPSDQKKLQCMLSDSKGENIRKEISKELFIEMLDFCRESLN